MQGSEGPVDLHPYADQECAQGGRAPNLACPSEIVAFRVFFRIWNMGGVNQPLGSPPFPSLLSLPSFPLPFT